MSLPNYQLLAKQAIYNKEKDCVGFELLFRSPLGIGAKDVGSEVATQQVLVNYCSSITESAELGSVPVFINVDDEFLRNHRTLPVDSGKVYIEVNQISAFDDEFLESLKAWTEQGFKLGLSGFGFSGAEVDVLPYFDFVKVNMLQEETFEVAINGQFPRHGEQLWIAERIESEEVFEQCRDAGYDLFQGYFLARPKDVKGASIRPGTAVTIRIVNELDRPNISMEQIADLVGQDPKLAVQMLKIINSPLFALPKIIEDLKDALVFLGIDMLRHWAMILAFLSNGSVHIEASRIILNRAKTSELMCYNDEALVKQGPTAFLAGLVSGVDVLVSVTPSQFLQQVELSENVQRAVLGYEGDVGQILKQVIDLEWTIAQQHFELSQLDEGLIEAYRAADAWVDQVVNILKA